MLMMTIAMKMPIIIKIIVQSAGMHSMLGTCGMESTKQKQRVIFKPQMLLDSKHTKPEYLPIKIYI